MLPYGAHIPRYIDIYMQCSKFRENCLTGVLSTSRCTLTEYDTIGSYEKESGSYSGAIGALQRGDIGFLDMPVYYPLIDPGDNFIYTPTLYEDTMTILSGYRTVNTSRSGDLLDMFTQVSLLLASRFAS